MSVRDGDPIEIDAREDDGDEGADDEAVQERDFEYLAPGELIEADMAAMAETTL